MSYNKKVWKSGDRITKEALNNMENGIEAAHQNSGGSGTSYDDTEIKTDINTIKTDLGTEELTTTAKNVKGAVNEVAAQYKDIVNLSLTKHTDGKVYIKKQDGTLIGDGIEISGSDVDLSKITMSMSGQTLKLMNGGTQVATVEIPTATVTDEQLTSIIQSKIDDGSLSALSIEDGSITPNKTDFLNKGNNTSIVNTNFTKYYDLEHGYFGGKGSYGTDLIDISKANKIKAYCGKNYVCWLSYKMDDKTTIMTLDKSDNYPYLFFEESIQLEDGNYLFEYDLNALKKLGVTQIILGFYGNEFNKEVIQIELINENILNKKELSIAPSYEFKISNDNIDDVSIDFEKINIYKSNKIIDFRKKKGTGFNTKLAGIYGSNKNLYGGFVDVSINKTIYSKYAISNKVSTNYIPFRFGCYDADKNLLYISSGFSAEGVRDETGVIGTPIASAYTMNGLEEVTEETLYGMCIQKITFPEEVKYIVFTDSPSYNVGSYQSFDSKYFCIGFELIDDLYLTNDKYYKGINPNLKNIISEIAQIKSTENEEPKRLACIGDSLTNWGGGDNSNNGFLKPIYEKLGINITNLGLAGETWEISKPSDGSTVDIKNVTGTSAIGRVNKIVSDNIGYDYILFFMGTNTKNNGTLQSPSTDPYTMCGAIKYCLETIMSKFPKTIIGVILPPMRVEDSHNIEGKSTMETKGEMIKTIANYYSVPVFDAHHESQIVAGNVVVIDGKPNSGNGSLSDGVHLGEIGIYHLGRKLANWVSIL
ncbi:SGNH/GDSL hydrolase family protein [Clostridium sp.]|uniref:SGNH/GDSL hydrolase family protein n=1 Tax=Clostridium sp. TaxID=1506 RepID=UPI003994BB0B